MVWDVIKDIYREKLYAQPGVAVISFDPLSDRLTKHINEYVDANKSSFERFRKKIFADLECFKSFCLLHIGMFFYFYVFLTLVLMEKFYMA